MSYATLESFVSLTLVPFLIALNRHSIVPSQLSAAPTSSSLPPALSSLTTLSHPAPSHPRSQSSSSFGRGRGGGGNGGGRASSRQSRPLVSSPSNLRSNHSKSVSRKRGRAFEDPSTMSSSVCPPKANKVMTISALSPVHYESKDHLEVQY
ncbi:hypothetical protein PRIPAC_93821 [Pristionchus pacificus]|uniref:Uncharacterized protein n=1 Tax=Pristionchus pacificus TaxID=54126 RepID=A0A2A6BIG6_PRIPA|nr:hypothetical protein PRIPAC_93821 [Pristionchus pacificus]|eukprot:PDM65700.1 hypothetical protein PRIPAC_45614 [Pristionchus pacificus]